MANTFVGGDSFSFIGAGGCCVTCCNVCCGVITVSTGTGSSIRCAADNVACGNYATALGRCNTASGLYSNVLGGLCNTASGCNSTVLNGSINTASGLYSSIVNGRSNTAQAISGFIGNGNCNFVCNSTSGCLAYGAVVVGGVGNNTTAGTWNIHSIYFNSCRQTSNQT